MKRLPAESSATPQGLHSVASLTPPALHVEPVKEVCPHTLSASPSPVKGVSKTSTRLLLLSAT